MSRNPPRLELCEAFIPLWNSTKRYFILTGGRGSLKSTHVHYFISDLTYEKGHGILFTRYTMTSAKLSIIPEFKVILERMGRLQDFIITNDRAINKVTGSFIVFKGIKTSQGDQTGRLKSISGITTWVIEEGEDFNDENTFDTIDDSIRTKEKQNRVIWIQNPTTKAHFIFQRFFKNTNYKKNYFGFDVTMSNHEDVEHIHTTYHIATKYLSKSILKNYRRLRKKALAMANRYKSKYYNKYIGGWREQAEGVIFENWIEGEFPEYLNSVYGMDYGFTDPLALIRVAVDHDFKKIYLDEIIYKSELSNSQLLRLIEQNTDPNALICTDHNEKRTNRFLQDNNINVVRAIKPKISENIRDIQDYQIVVTPRSTNIKEELNEYKWHDKKAELPIDAWNHAIDASRYGYNELNRYN